MSKKRPNKKKIINNTFSIKGRLVTHPASRKTVERIKKEIKGYIEGNYSRLYRLLNNCPYDHWYVGITHNDEQRTKGHKSSKKLKELRHFLSWQAGSVSNARTIEMELCKEFGLNSCQVAGGISEKSKRVYVYNYNDSDTRE